MLAAKNTAHSASLTTASRSTALSQIAEASDCRDGHQRRRRQDPPGPPRVEARDRDAVPTSPPRGRAAARSGTPRSRRTRRRRRSRRGGTAPTACEAITVSTAIARSPWTSSRCASAGRGGWLTASGWSRRGAVDGAWRGVRRVEVDLLLELVGQVAGVALADVGPVAVRDVVADHARAQPVGAEPRRGLHELRRPWRAAACRSESMKASETLSSSDRQLFSVASRSDRHRPGCSDDGGRVADHDHPVGVRREVVDLPLHALAVHRRHRRRSSSTSSPSSLVKPRRFASEPSSTTSGCISSTCSRAHSWNASQSVLGPPCTIHGVTSEDGQPSRIRKYAV